jgi:LysM repeat protein
MNTTMWKKPPRRSVSSATIWGISLLGFGGLIFWYLGWLPVSFQSPETGSLDRNSALAESGVGDDSVSLFPEFNVASEGFDLVQADATGFPSQTEPSVDEEIADPPMPMRPGHSDSAAGQTKLAQSPFNSPSSAATTRTDVSADPFHKAHDDVAAGHRANVFPFDVEHIGATGRTGAIIQTGGELSADNRVPAEVAAKLHEIDGLIQNDQQLVAHRELSTLYWVKPHWRRYFQERIEKTAQSIYFSGQRHYMQPYEVQPGDRLESIARGYDVPWEYLVRLNGIDPRKIRPGQKLKVIKGPFSARIDLSEFALTIHAHGYFVRRYQVGIGKEGTTPVGKFKVMTKIVNPTYFGPEGNVIDGDDPTNPLAERWIDIGDSYGIHGTIDPQSVGRAVSRGCIRMFNSDVEEVYDLLGVGSEVVISR